MFLNRPCAIPATEALTESLVVSGEITRWYIKYMCVCVWCSATRYACRAGFTQNRALFRKNVWAPWAPAGIFARGSTEVPQRGPGAEPRWGSRGEAPRSWRNIVKNDVHDTSFSVYWHHLQHERFLLHNPNFIVNFFTGNTTYHCSLHVCRHIGALSD